MRYMKRIVDKEIKDKLSISGALLIRGPKWCGKTTSAKQIAKSVLELQNPDLQENYFDLLDTKPSLLLVGDKPRLIDEWQIAPKIWNAVRHNVDATGKLSQFILTGSATPVEDKTLHTGTGRFAFITMKGMSSFESGDSNGTVSISSLRKNETNIDGKKSDLTLERIAYLTCRGGWPNSIKIKGDRALEISKNYLDVLFENDISKVDGVKRNPSLARAILRAYARQVSTIDSDRSLFRDIKANHAEVSDRTIIDYINTLKKLYIVEEIEAWNPNIRSKTSIRTSPKKSLTDPSLAVAALGCTPDELMQDMRTFGLLFENLANRDLSVYVDSIGGHLKHYRDRFGLECDNVIHFNDGKYALVEIKLGGSKIREAEEHLITLRDLILKNEKSLGKPEFLMIITGTEIAYTTENGVYIVPLGCLRN